MNLWNFLADIVFGILNAIISLFPDANPDITDQITGSVNAVRGYLANASFFFPVNQLLIVLGIILSVELTLLGIKATSWIASNVSFGFFKRL